MTFHLINRPKLASCVWLHKGIHPLTSISKLLSDKRNTDYNIACLQKIFTLSVKCQVHFRECSEQLEIYSWRIKYRSITNEVISSLRCGYIRLYHHADEGFADSEKIVADYFRTQADQMNLGHRQFFARILWGMW